MLRQSAGNCAASIKVSGMSSGIWAGIST